MCKRGDGGGGKDGHVSAGDSGSVSWGPVDSVLVGAKKSKVAGSFGLLWQNFPSCEFRWCSEAQGTGSYLTSEISI